MDDRRWKRTAGSLSGSCVERSLSGEQRVEDTGESMVIFARITMEHTGGLRRCRSCADHV